METLQSKRRGHMMANIDNSTVLMLKEVLIKATLEFTGCYGVSNGEKPGGMPPTA